MTINDIIQRRAWRKAGLNGRARTCSNYEGVSPLFSQPKRRQTPSTIGQCHLILAAACVLSFLPSYAFAQLEQAIPYPRYAPAPIGSPGITWSPRPNPYGPAPQPIAPAPYPSYGSATPYGSTVPYGSAVPFGSADPYGSTPYSSTLYGPAYPAYGRPAVPYSGRIPRAEAQRPVYPVEPYVGRMASPFDPAADFPAASVPPGQIIPAPGLQAYDDLQQTNYQSSVIAPAPIGNLRLTISEGFLNRFVARNEQKPGEVRDFILGADVSGHQITDTSLRLDLRPSPDKVLGTLVLNGTTHSQTVGVTRQAVIDTDSEQRFIATKDVIFDGVNLSTRHATVHVQANNQTIGAKTPMSGSLFGGIADRIAYRVAERRKPEAEAIARDRVVDRVYPEFDTEIDRQLGSANDLLERTVRPRLRSMNLMPSQQAVSSSDLAMTYSALIGNEYTRGPVSPQETAVLNGTGMQLQVHQSLLNTLFGSLNLKRYKTTDKELKALFAPYEVAPTADELERKKVAIPLPGAEKMVTEIEFDDEDPLTIKLERDVALVTMRAKFRPAGQDLIPELAVTIEYRSQIVGNKIVITPGKVQVDLQNPQDETISTGIVLRTVSQAIEADLAKLAFDRTVPSNFWTLNGIVPSITSIQTTEGWASISIE